MEQDIMKHKVKSALVWPIPSGMAGPAVFPHWPDDENGRRVFHDGYRPENGATLPNR
jgi:hypothetical protein